MQLEHFQIQDEVLLASLSRLRMSAIKSGSDVIGLSISDYELLFQKLFKSIISSLSIRLAESWVHLYQLLLIKSKSAVP